MAGPLDRAFVEILPDFSKFGKELKKGVDDATKVLEARFEASMARIERSSIRTARNVAQHFNDAFAGLVRDADNAADDAEDALRDIDAPDVDVDVDVDPRQVDDEVDDAVRRADPPDINVDVNADREGSFARFLSSITGVRLPIAGFTALAGAAGAAGTALIQFAAAAAPAVGIVAGLPAAIGVGAAAIGTLQLATQGMGEAFEAAFGSAEDFDAAMEGLAPSAQASAQAFRDLTPAMTELQQSAQQGFFDGMAAGITAAGNALLGPLTEGATAAATGMGNIVDGLLNIAASSTGVDFVSSSFSTLNAIIANISEPVQNLFTALLDLGTAINTAFGGEEAGAGLASLIQRFADFITAATESGEAVGWVENALAVFQALGDILSPIVGIIGAIGSIASDTGGNILGVFGQALGAIEEFLTSAEGIDTVTTLFEMFNTIGGLFGDILAGIGPALPPIISGISALVSAVAPLIAPLATIVGELLTALAPLLTAVADAIEPLIDPIVSLAQMIGGVLVTAINAVMPIVTSLLNIFSAVAVPVLNIITQLFAAFSPIITTLLAALMPLFEALTPIFDLLAMLGDILATILVPIFEVLGEILLWVVETIIIPVLIPIIEFLAELFATVLTDAIQGFVDFFTTIVDVLVGIFNFFKDAWNTSIDNIMAAWDAFQILLEIGKQFIQDNVFEPIQNGISAVGDFISGVLDDIESGWDSFIDFLGSIPDRISGAVSGMWDGIWDAFKGAINSIIDGWNNLSFSVPSVDMGPLGEFGGFTLSTPNIPRLQVGGMSMGEGLAYLDPNEAILPLEDPRTTDLLAAALGRAVMDARTGTDDESAPSGPVTGQEDIVVRVYIGDRELTDIVDVQIDQHNETMLRRARAGTRRNR